MNKLEKHSDKFYIQQVNAESLELIPNTKKDLEQDFVSLLYKSLTNTVQYGKKRRYTEEFAERCKKVMHSTAKQAATIAEKAKVGKLIIGHYSARIENHELLLNEAREVFPNTFLAIERETYLV